MRDCERVINMVQDSKLLNNKIKISPPNKITFSSSDQNVIEKILGDGKIDYFY